MEEHPRPSPWDAFRRLRVVQAGSRVRVALRSSGTESGGRLYGGPNRLASSNWQPPRVGGGENAIEFAGVCWHPLLMLAATVTRLSGQGPLTFSLHAPRVCSQPDTLAGHRRWG